MLGVWLKGGLGYRVILREIFCLKAEISFHYAGLQVCADAENVPSFDSNPMAYCGKWAQPILAPDQQFA